ncbi:hypothetical protein C6Y45_04055 [Alkalicoccus saliphilus]|uniref:Uncharacterized protein n=1 Tax=Alkalicoccus saliphilus TaxID=200989 RepID=A0A2T4U8U5_9BACI|nr:hypothetical protein C6Y45_04055 [Alkalicoccus saliphilus]
MNQYRGVSELRSLSFLSEMKGAFRALNGRVEKIFLKTGWYHGNNRPLSNDMGLFYCSPLTNHTCLREPSGKLILTELFSKRKGFYGPHSFPQDSGEPGGTVFKMWKNVQQKMEV